MQWLCVEEKGKQRVAPRHDFTPISVDRGDYANSSGMTEEQEWVTRGRGDLWTLRVVTRGMKFSTPLEFNAINVGLNHEVL